MYVVLMTVILSISALFLIPFGREGIILFFLSLFIIVIGITTGPITALSTTLLIYFLIGSVMFWAYLTKSFVVHVNISYVNLLLWTVIILFLSLISGRLSTLVKNIAKDKRQLEEQIRTLVAVDSVTGFDNKSRMLVELELEYNRSKRYETPFSFLLLKVNHLDQFQRLYGNREYERLLQHIAKKLFRLIRLSDLKFRVDDDKFALLLTNTPIQDIDTVIEKIDKELSVYQLENKKYISLSITYGYAGFPSNIKDAREILEAAQEQVSLHES